MPDYRRRAVREAASVRLDVNGAAADLIGDGGITGDELAALGPRISEVTHALKGRRSAGELPVLDVPGDAAALTAMRALAADVREECDTLVVLGIGGSVRGAASLVCALGDTSPRMVIVDGLDPCRLGALLDGLDPERTTFNIISHSGDTPQTLAQFLIVRDVLLHALGAVDYARRVVVTTDAEHGALRQVVHDEGFRDIVVPAGIGARFSVLTVPALFPAAVAGARVDDVLAGAAWMESRCQSPDVRRNPAHLLATLLYLADTRRRQNVVVVLPYSDRLSAFAHWCAHLWTESLGKAPTLEGAAAHVGQTVVAGEGTGAHHDWLQLLTEGPRDKVVCMIRVEDHGRELAVPPAFADLEGIGYLGAGGVGSLLNLEQRAAEAALAEHGRPTVVLTLPQLNAFTMGQLCYLFEAATLFAAGLYRIDPFTQPGADAARRLLLGLAGRAGFESERARVEALLARKRDDYIV
jgi:glucose-6-phosphate isomerase